MSDPGKSKPNQGVRDQAITWLVRIQSERATAGDWAALTTWLETSEVHLTAFEDAERLSSGLTGAAPLLLEALKKPSANVVVFPARSSPAPRRARIFALLAASWVAAIIAGAWLWQGYKGPLEVFQTKPGETRAVTFRDGTRVRLDMATTLSARVGWGQRRVTLGDGEATFDVAKDAARPFVVAVGDQRVRVVGTEFNIRHYDRKAVITVRRGVVEVYAPMTGSKPIARLTPGWAEAHADGADEARVRRVDADAAFAWTQGRLICDDQPLSEIVAYLNRRYVTPIRLSDAAGKRRFSGVLVLGDQQEVTRDLARYLSLVEHRDAGRITLR